MPVSLPATCLSLDPSMISRFYGSRSSFRRVLAFCSLCVFASQAARAATYTWKGAGGNNAWSTAANWVGNAAPPSDLDNTDIIFGVSDAIFPSINSAYSIHALTWNAGASAYIFDTGPLTLGAGGFTQNAANAQTFSAPVLLGAGQTWTLADGTGALTFNGGVNTAGGPGNANRALTINAATTSGSGNVINGNFTGGGSLSKTGAGILTLTGTASTYGGGTTISAGTLAFDNAGALGGGAVTLNAGELRATATATFNNRVNANAGAISAAPGTTLTLGSLYVGNSFTAGAVGQTGIVTLAGGNGNGINININISTLTVAAGTLRGGADSVLNFYTSNAASTTVNAGATLDLNGFNTTVNNLQGAGALTTGGTAATVLTVNAGSFSGAITGSGALTKATAGALVLTGTNTYAGATTLSGGTLQVGDGGTGGTLGAGSVTNNAALVFNRSDALAYNGAITGTGTLAKQGAGTLTLGGSQAANTFTGLTSVTAGTLVLNKGSNVAALAGALSIGNSSNPGAAGSAVVRLLNGGQTGSGTNVTILPDGLLDFNSTVASIGALTMTGGTLASGGNAGGPDLNGDVTINTSATGSRITGTGTFGFNVGLSGAARTFSVADGAARYDLDVGASLFSGTLVKAGPGALRLDGTNSPGSLAVTLNTGTLAVGRDAALRGPLALTLAGGTIVPDGGSAVDAGARTVSKPVNVTGNATVGSSLDGTAGGLTFTEATSLAAGATLTVSSNAGTTFSNVVSGPGSLVKTGAGTLTLGHAANTFTGGLTLNGGTLAIAGEGSLGGAANVVTLNAGRLQFAADTTTTRTFNFNNALTLGTAPGTTLTFGNGASVNGGFLGAGGTLAFTDGSALSGATTALGSVVTTTGVVSFTNANLRGATTVNAGSTSTATNTALSSAGTLTVNGRVNSTGLESSGVTTINNGGTVANGGGSLYLGGGSRTNVNTGGTLSSASGTTIELNGALLTNNGAQTGTLNVNYGSTAKGSGTFGSVNVGDGGRFGANTSSGGASVNGLANFRLKGADRLAEAAFVGPQLRVVPGTVNVGSLTLNSGSLLAVNVQDAQGTAGAGYDTALVQGALTLNGYRTAGDQITIALSSLGSNGSAGAAANFDPCQSYVLTLVTASGGITGFDAASFQVDTSSFQNSLGGGHFFVAQDGNNLNLDFTPVPESATWLGGALLLVGAAGTIRRRVRRSA